MKTRPMLDPLTTLLTLLDAYRDDRDRYRALLRELQLAVQERLHESYVTAKLFNGHGEPVREVGK